MTTAAIRVTVRGLGIIQRANQQAIKAVETGGGLGRAVQIATVDAERHAIYNTPWDTTTLRKSHRMELTVGRNDAVGRIFIDPSVVRSWDGKRPAVYGAELHQQGLVPGVRGGIRAFYLYTVSHDGPEIATKAVRQMLRELPK